MLTWMIYMIGLSMNKFKQIKLIKGETDDQHRNPFYEVTLNNDVRYLAQRNPLRDWFGYVIRGASIKTEMSFGDSEEQAILWIIGKSFE
jgi:hypothetical protein